MEVNTSCYLFQAMQQGLSRCFYKKCFVICIHNNFCCICLLHHMNHRSWCKKNFEATFFFIDFFKAFDSTQRGKIEQILLAYGLPPETVIAIIMIYRSLKVKVHLLDGERLLQNNYRSSARGYIRSYLFIIYLDYIQ